jgi:hypothetical protein
MTEPTIIVKGGFRATLALIFSLIALIFSILAYSSVGREEGMRDQIKNLRATIEKIKSESTEQLNKLRNETASTLEKMSQIVKKEEGNKESTEGSTDEETN